MADLSRPDGPITRRRFLRIAGMGAATAPFVRVPWARALGMGGPALAEASSAAGGTTLASTIVRGAALRAGTLGTYYRLTSGPGEPHLRRQDLGPRSNAPIRQAIAFVHYTDTHVIDAQSPARVEFLDRYDDVECEAFPLESAHRPQETLTVQVAEAMNRRVRGLKKGPATGAPLRFAVCTGDNIDNEQTNELRWFIDVMDGGTTIRPDSGAPGRYEGVQAADWGDPEYWHPDPVADKYKEEFGFPEFPGLLEQALTPFASKGVGMPWWQTYGNHDGLMQGNAPRNEAFNAIAVGGTKVDGPPPGLNPCNPFESLPLAPGRPVTPDPARRVIRRREYIEEHFRTTGTPSGHGFTAKNRADATAYYARDDVPGFRFISLDTVNPGGFSEGSIGAAQLAWLEQRLIEVSSRYFAADGSVVTTGKADRRVILFSHHGLRSLENPVIAPDPDPQNQEVNDLPRVMAPEVEALLHRFPNVIAWVNGHTHNNVLEARPDPAGRTGGFWDIGTAAHVDWSSQVRVVEVAIRADGAVSIFTTMIDHAGPASPSGATGVLRLASISRELQANDPQAGYDRDGRGEVSDRNAELCLPPRA